MLVKLLRRLLGYVEFYAEGGFAERFVNLCTLEGINLTDVKNDGVKVYACTDFNGYKRIKKCARGSGMHVKIIKKHGIYIFLRSQKARIGAVFGAFAAVMLILFFSGGVWSVNIEGASDVKLQSLTKSLDDLGVFVGARKRKIDTEKVAKSLLNNNPELSWASLNMYGTRVVLEVREVTASPETKDLNVPVNIVASKRGRVVLINGHRGTNRVKEGDYVEKGDILISGITVNRDLSENIVRASGSVVCETENKKEVLCPYKSEALLCKKEKTAYKLGFFGVEIPLFFKIPGECGIGIGKVSLRGGGEALPIYILWESRADFSETSIELTKEEAFLAALAECVEAKRELLEGCEVKSLEMTKNINSSGVAVSFEADCVEDIAEEQVFYRDSELKE